ncbi:MAG: succinylglutamate desuccinylase [Arenicella sp.]|nr:succinylglutamate desuccinylase [Arenicella sp.]
MSFLKTTLANPISAEPHSLMLENGVNLELLETGVLRVSPARQGDYRIVISCGIHGNETAPIEMVEKIFSEIKSGKLTVTNELLLIIGNPPAANQAVRFIDENLNRLFSGKHQSSSTKEARRAKLIEDHVAEFYQQGEESRLHYDLHTAIRGSELEKFAVYPYLHNRDWPKTQIAFLERCGLEAILLSTKPAGTFSYFTSTQFGADSFTIELGKVRKFGDNDMRNFADAMQGLRELISGQEDFSSELKSIQVFSVVEEVIKRSEALKLHVADDAKNFTAFPKGSLLASDEGYEYRTQQDGERFVFPITNIPIGQRAMLVVAPTIL